MVDDIHSHRSYLPLLATLKSYRREDFGHDLAAGLVVGVITVPQAIAYAFLAGLPPQAGLYACLVPMLIYAFMGSSKHLVVGPVAVAALMVSAMISEYAPQHSDAYLQITSIVCLEAGLFLLLLRVSNMGGVVNLLSHPVIVGFINAAAIMIIVSQLRAFAGIPGATGDNPLERGYQLVTSLHLFNPTTLQIATAALLGLWLVQRWSVPLLRSLMPNLPDQHPIKRIGPVVVACIATLVVWSFDLDTNAGVATIGHVPQGLPSLTWPSFDAGLWLELAPGSAMIALVAYVESFSIGTMLATRKRTRLNANQELIALGAANIGAAVTGAYPVAGSFARSSVNYQSGARTPVSSLVCAVIILLTLVFFTPLFTHMPQAALAAIIIMSISSLIDFRSFRIHWRIYPEDSITQIATFLSVLAFGVETGLLTGVVLSIAFFVRQSSRPHVAVVGRVADTQHFRSTRRHPVETLEQITAVRVDENLYFANANQVEGKLLKAVQRQPQTKHLLLVCSAINMVDISGLEMLTRLNANLKRMHVQFHLSEVKGPVMDQLEATEFLAELSGSVFFTTDQAIRDLAEAS